MQAIQTTNIAEELVNNTHCQFKEEEAQHIPAMQTFSVAEKRVKELTIKLIEANRDRKSVEAALAGAEK